MITEMIKKRTRRDRIQRFRRDREHLLERTVTRNRPDPCPHPKTVNLYRFIRLVLGPDISSRQIARRWKMDEKNFYEFRVGRYPVPRLERLEKLARMLGLNKYLVFQVAGGASADKVYNLIKKNNLPGQIKLLGFDK